MLTLNLSPDFGGPACVLSLTLSTSQTSLKQLRKKETENKKGEAWVIEGKGEGEEEERGQRKKKEVKRRGMWLPVT